MRAVRDHLGHLSAHIGRTVATMSPLFYVALLGVAAIAILSSDFYLKEVLVPGHRVRAVHGELGRAVRVLGAGSETERIRALCGDRIVVSDPEEANWLDNMSSCGQWALFAAAC